MPRIANPFAARGPVAAISAVCYAALCLALWPVPLLNRLQVESAALLATAGFFAAGLGALRSFAAGGGFGRELGRALAATLVPLALMTAAMLWAPNCTYGQGLAFFVLFVLPSVVLGVSLAWALALPHGRRRTGAFLAAGAALLVAPVVFDIGFHPQFYSYNHVFGGFLGPIYDEELLIRSGLVVYRAMTMLVALLAYTLGEARRGRRKTGLALGAALLLAAGYALAPRLGIVTTYGRLASELGGMIVTPHFEIYYDPASLTDGELQVLAEDHEYRYHVLATRLGVEPPERIRSYLYPDADTRARLTGARFTNVAPVWLGRPQAHVLLDAYTDVFPHELAHVFSRSFGMPVIHASWSVGLVEGFAEAMEPPSGRPSMDEQVYAAASAGGADQEAMLAVRARSLADRLSPFGFWTGRGAVSYTMMGSFVQYLIAAYGVDRFKAVYARGDFERVYGKSVDALAGEWERHVARLPALDIGVRGYVVQRFGRPSLFERECPHYVPPHIRRYREALEALAAGDTVSAEGAIEAALAIDPRFEAAQVARAGLLLSHGDAAAALERFGAYTVIPREARGDTVSVGMQFVMADALAMGGEAEPARALYAAIERSLPPYQHNERALVQLRGVLAGHPGLVRIARSALEPEAKAERLDAWRETTPAVAYLQSQYLAAAERFDDAIAALDAAPALSPALDRQRLVWLALFQYRAGRVVDALATLDRAIAAFDAAGALGEVLRLTDFKRRLTYIQTHPLPIETPPTAPS
ncbi:MAG: hypothetical protein R2834_12560 [Rhodothermales bacterium]